MQRFVILDLILIAFLIMVQEFPYVRYRAAMSASDASATTTARELVPTKVAASLWDKLMKYKSSLLNFPQLETCDLVIVDRSIDPVCLIYFSLQTLLSAI